MYSTLRDFLGGNNLAVEAYGVKEVHGSGTSEGADKGWDTRGRSQQAIRTNPAIKWSAKESDWKYVKGHVATSAKEDIKNLPVVKASPKAPTSDYAGHNGQVHVLEHGNGHSYLVNPEGFGYARYAADMGKTGSGFGEGAKDRPSWGYGGE